MAQYGILVDSVTGIPVYDAGLTESQFPPESAMPAGVDLVIFTESTPQFELLHAFFFGDPNRLTSDYKLNIHGGVVYDKAANTFSFHKKDLTININQLKSVRNELLKATDKYMFIPDLPQDIKTDILAYRQALRDAPNKVNNEWRTVYDVQWPEFPQKLIKATIAPPEPAN